MDSQQLYIISVPFDFEWKEVENHRGHLIELLYQRNHTINLPGLDYLLEHAQNVETDTYYDAAAMLYRLSFRFYLTGSDATMYRLKYS